MPERGGRRGVERSGHWCSAGLPEINVGPPQADLLCCHVRLGCPPMSWGMSGGRVFEALPAPGARLLLLRVHPWPSADLPQGLSCPRAVPICLRTACIAGRS